MLSSFSIRDSSTFSLSSTQKAAAQAQAQAQAQDSLKYFGVGSGIARHCWNGIFPLHFECLPNDDDSAVPLSYETTEVRNKIRKNPPSLRTQTVPYRVWPLSFFFSELTLLLHLSPPIHLPTLLFELVLRVLPFPLPPTLCAVMATTVARMMTDPAAGPELEPLRRRKHENQKFLVRRGMREVLPL
ncbi:hypothetical protein BDP27DRAFT_1427711 [Rhodocollybia butyracea]|uniref:Uncharacterized protein n=1 Tax=Rhodocollybia butyracea TaxID=206335 RepID=A0A9P5PBQ7_9AGAR|nr:hypothetical protein BDP27DRAFT_1427711 [Rhodocollybia butyracea]